MKKPILATCIIFAVLTTAAHAAVPAKPNAVITTSDPGKASPPVVAKITAEFTGEVTQITCDLVPSTTLPASTSSSMGTISLGETTPYGVTGEVNFYLAVAAGHDPGCDAAARNGLELIFTGGYAPWGIDGKLYGTDGSPAGAYVTFQTMQGESGVPDIDNNKTSHGVETVTIGLPIEYQAIWWNPVNAKGTHFRGLKFKAQLHGGTEAGQFRTGTVYIVTYK